jgi:hypothetical protein
MHRTLLHRHTDGASSRVTIQALEKAKSLRNLTKKVCPHVNGSCAALFDPPSISWVSDLEISIFLRTTKSKCVERKGKEKEKKR